MAKKPTLTDISSGYASNATINSNNDAIETAFENTLSLDGSTPNAMNADLDLNSNNINNVNTVNASAYKLNGVSITATVFVPDWKGAWATTTDYVLNDIVLEDNVTYICLEAHTAGTFATDLAANKWEIFAGSGDYAPLSHTHVITDILNLQTTLNTIDADITQIEADLANAGGGLYKGENGQVGGVAGAGDIFRINEQTLNTNVTIDADENASATGPLTIASGTTLTITAGGNLSIV